MVIKIEKELDEMEAAIAKMGRKVIAMHEKVLQIVENPNKEVALNIIQSDDFVNHLEEEINDLAVGALALLSPVASDLRRVVAGIKIASELERIGDYAKNIGVFMIKHEQVDSVVLEYAQQMEKSFLQMLETTMEAYVNKDGEKAFEIPEMDEEIDQLTNELNTKLRSFTDIDQLKHALSVGSMLRSVERAGDHTKNICEHIIYLVKGQHYDFG